MKASTKKKWRRGADALDDNLPQIELPEAPTFRPTEVEFVDPMKYIASIEPVARKYGICKIVPPAVFRKEVPKEFAFKDDVEFPTRKQALHQLCNRNAPAIDFVDKLNEFRRVFLQKQGFTNKTMPKLSGRVVPLLKLYNSVVKKGGYEEVVKNKRWPEVAYDLRLSGTTTAASFLLRSIYERTSLVEYERYEREDTYLKTKVKHEDDVASPSVENGESGENIAYDGESAERAITIDDSQPSGVQVLESREKSADDEASVEPPTKKLKVESDADDAIVPPKQAYQCKECRLTIPNDASATCHMCKEVFHRMCLLPGENPLCTFCKRRMSRMTDFGFETGSLFTFHKLKTFANHYKDGYFSSVAKSEEQIEKEYWAILDDAETFQEVVYGADIHSELYGSGFPKVGDTFTAKHPWNLNNLPFSEGSVLGNLGSKIAGISTPWVYVGMVFSTFCWHNEDNYMHSISYHHQGAPKMWYGVSGDDAPKFEQVFREVMPDMANMNRSVLHDITTMVNPMRLKAEGVAICRAVQRPGEFIVTFPQAYHGGFSLGFNCTEAVNFATSSWFKHGRQAVTDYQQRKRPPVFSHEEVVIKSAKRDNGVEILQRLIDEMSMIISNEKKRRGKLEVLVPNEPDLITEDTDEELHCVVCKHQLWVSYVTCLRCRELACLEHGGEVDMCKCQKLSLRKMYYRYTCDSLVAIQNMCKQRLARLTNSDEVICVDEEPNLKIQDVDVGNILEELMGGPMSANILSRLQQCS